MQKGEGTNINKQNYHNLLCPLLRCTHAHTAHSHNFTQLTLIPSTDSLSQFVHVTALKPPAPEVARTKQHGRQYEIQPSSAQVPANTLTRFSHLNDILSRNHSLHTSLCRQNTVDTKISTSVCILPSSIHILIFVSPLQYFIPAELPRQRMALQTQDAQALAASAGKRHEFVKTHIHCLGNDPFFLTMRLFVPGLAQPVRPRPICETKKAKAEQIAGEVGLPANSSQGRNCTNAALSKHEKSNLVARRQQKDVVVQEPGKRHPQRGTSKNLTTLHGHQAGLATRRDQFRGVALAKKCNASRKDIRYSICILKNK